MIPTRLASVLARLTPLERAVAHAHAVEGKTFRQIAQESGRRSEGTISDAWYSVLRKASAVQ